MNKDLARASMIFKKEEMERLELNENGSLQLDMHGLSRTEGRKLLNNLVLLAMDSREIKVIHGYRHGQALRDMIRDEYHHKKVAAIEADGTNPGVTFLKIA